MTTSASEKPQPPPMAVRPIDRLDSWKDVANYLRRGVRTVQRWERDKGLPVHRIPGAGRGTIYALKSEVDGWWQNQGAQLEAEESRRVSPKRKRRRLAWAATLLAAGLMGAAAVWLIGPTAKAPEASLIAVPLTSYQGQELDPTFSPDGNEIAFSWNGPNQDNFDIYRKQIGPWEPSRLTDDPARDFSPVWSPDGRFIAFLRELGTDKVRVIMIPALGGPERELGVAFKERLGPVHPPSPRLAWSPEGKWLLLPDRASEQGPSGLFLLSMETGEKERLTNAPVTGVADTGPAFSPDGRALAFSRTVAYGVSQLYVLDLSEEFTPAGALRQITSDAGAAASPVWAPDGTEIIFAAENHGVRALWRVAASGSGSPRRLAVGEGVGLPAISRQGRRLVYVRQHLDRSIWRLELAGVGGQPKPPVRFFSSTRMEWFPRFSPDGKRVAFQSSHSGVHEIWVCNSDGTEPRQLTSTARGMSGSPRWSPDGKWIAFDSTAEGQFEIYVVSVDGGKPRRLTHDPGNDVVPSWSRDGEWIYFSSNRTGKRGIWKTPAEGGEAVRVTRNGGFVTCESPDGRSLYLTSGGLEGDSDILFSLWQIPAVGGEATRILESVYERNFAVVDRGIYFIPAPDQEGFSIRFLSFADGAITTVARLEGAVSGGFTVSPDCRTFLYTRTDVQHADLMLVENFR